MTNLSDGQIVDSPTQLICISFTIYQQTKDIAVQSANGQIKRLKKSVKDPADQLEPNFKKCIRVSNQIVHSICTVVTWTGARRRGFPTRDWLADPVAGRFVQSDREAGPAHEQHFVGLISIWC